jgi:hypothetical protein
MVRGACLANRGLDYIGPAGTIPSFAVYHAAAMARNALLGLPPVADGMTNPRRDEQTAAQKFIDSLATMNPSAFKADPTPPAETASYGGSKLLEF